MLCVLQASVFTVYLQSDTVSSVGCRLSMKEVKVPG